MSYGSRNAKVCAINGAASKRREEPAYETIRIDSNNIHLTLKANERAVFKQPKTQAFILQDRSGQKQAFPSFESLLASMKDEISRKEVTAVRILQSEAEMSQEELDKMIKLLADHGLKFSLIKAAK